MKNVFLRFSLVIVLVVAAAGSGCRSTYYAVYEKMGVHKRDLLKKRVVEARDEQQEAGAQFKDAMTRLKELYAFDGGELEKRYTSLQKEYEECQSRAEAVRGRIKSMETVAGDLFGEWAAEITQISTPAMRESSRKQLDATRQRYNTMRDALRKAEQTMTPVLTQLRDHVLFLKHNLNAQAVASLKGEGASIQTEISRLITQMNAAIKQADEFVKTLQ